MSGRLVSIVGVMGSGKTEKLIEIYNKCKELDMGVLVFKPIIDTRTDYYEVLSRSGKRAPATPIKNVEDIFDYDSSLQQVILIDEIQFFDQHDVVNSLMALCLKGIDVYCFGLDLTSDGTTFGMMGEVLANSDEVIKLDVKCSRCGENNARVTQYMGDDKVGDVKIGDLDLYVPVCRSCYYDDDLNEIEILDDTDDDPLIFFEVGGTGYGFRMDLLIKKSRLDDAGYTPDDVRDISTLEGANNLLVDLGMVEEREGWDCE